MKIEFRPISRGRQTLFHLFTASFGFAAGVKAKVVPHSGSSALRTRNPLEAGILRKKVQESRKSIEPHGL
jgi:hypothetical protein